MPELKAIKQLLTTVILMCGITIGLTCYGIHRSEITQEAFVAKITSDSIHREEQLSLKLNASMQHQMLGLRENFISWQIDQVTQTRKLVALEVASQLYQSQEAK